MALFTGATIQTKLGGVFGLSSYLLMHNKIKEFAAEANGVNKDTPFFMGHGDSDPLIKHDWGVQTAEALKSELGHTNLEFKTYRYAKVLLSLDVVSLTQAQGSRSFG